MLTLYKVFQAGSYFLHIVQSAIFIYAVLTWFRPRFQLFYWLEGFVAPFVRPFRRLSVWITARTNMPLDFSCWFAIAGLQVVDWLWNRLYLLLRMIDMSGAELDKKRLRELALRAAYSGRSAFTRFLEPPMEREARAAAAEAGVHLELWGGFDAAERRIAAFYAQEAPAAQDYPIACLELRWNPRYADPGHRDLLGAAMGLGLERDATGDIALGAAPGRAYLFAHADVADYICGNLESAGRASLRVAETREPPELRPPQGEELRVTVSSERLDAVIAAGFKLSRAEAQRHIDAALVKRNHLPETRGDQRLEAGDLISVRGYGRMKVLEFEGLTRKGRLAVRLFRYTA